MGHIDFGRRYIRIKKPFQWRIDVRSLIVTSILFVIIMVLGVSALMMGSLDVSGQDVINALTGKDAGMAGKVILEWRLPRVIAAIVFGAGLAVSGAIFQSITRNPLGSPDIIGFSSGSYTGALLVMLGTGSVSYIGVAAGALAGGFITAILIYLFAFRQGIQGFRLIIVGIAISTILGSFNNMLLIKNEAEVALTAASWGIGSLNGIGWKHIIPAMIFVVLLLFCAWVMTRPLREMELGHDVAKSHGVRIERSQIILIMLAVALIAAPTAVMGPVSFVALAAPQIVLRFLKTAESIIPSAVMGSLMLLVADVLAQQIIPDIILPVGVITLSIGGIYLVWLLYYQARSAF